MRRLHVCLRISDELRIALMVDSLDPGQDFSQCGIMAANVIGQFGLRIRRSGNKHGAGVRNRFGYGLKIVVIR